MISEPSIISSTLNAEFDRRGEKINVESTILKSQRSDITRPYLMVAPDVAESDLAFTRLAEINRVIVEVCIQKNFLADLSGIEVLSRVVRNGIAKRILRLSILPNGLEMARRISGTDLHNPEPFPGVHSLIYMKNLPEVSCN